MPVQARAKSNGAFARAATCRRFPSPARRRVRIEARRLRNMTSPIWLCHAMEGSFLLRSDAPAKLQLGLTNGLEFASHRLAGGRPLLEGLRPIGRAGAVVSSAFRGATAASRKPFDRFDPNQFGAAERTQKAERLRMSLSLDGVSSLRALRRLILAVLVLAPLAAMAQSSPPPSPAPSLRLIP